MGISLVTARINYCTLTINKMEYAQLATITHVFEGVNSFLMLLLFTMLSPLHNQIPILSSIHISQMYLTGGPTSWLLFGLAFSIAVKLCTAILILVRKDQPRPLHYQAVFALIAAHEVLMFTFDLTTVICSAVNGFNTYLPLAAFNVLICLLIKLYRELYFSNYAFLCGNPYKKLPNLLCFTIKTSMYAACVYLIPTAYTPYGLALAAFYIFGSLKSHLLDTPYIIDQTADICIVQTGLNCASVVTGALAYIGDLYRDNSLVTFLLLSVLIPVVLVLTRANHNRNLLLLEADSIDNFRQGSIRLQNLYTMICSASETANRTLTSFTHLHLTSCVIVDCSCKSTNELWDFRKNTRVRGSTTAAKNSNGRIFLKYLLLSQCKENQLKFPSNPSAYLLHLSAITMLGIYTQAYRQTCHVQQSFSRELSLYDSGVLYYLKTENEEILKKRQLSLNLNNISALREIQQKQQQLKGLVSEVVDGRFKLWNYMNNSFNDMDIVFGMHEQDLRLREKVIATYEECCRMNNSSEELLTIMYAYASYIVQDQQLSTRISREIVLDRRIVSNGLLRSYIESQSSLSLLDNPNTCLVKASHHDESIGKITWHCKNFCQLFKVPGKSSMVGQNVATLLPSAYRPHHDGYIKRWLANPVPNRMNRYLDTYIQTFDNVIFKSILYLRVCPGLDDLELFGMMHKLETEQYLLLSKDMKVLTRAKFFNEIIPNQANRVEQMDLGLFSFEMLQLQHELEDGQFKGTTKTLDIGLVVPEDCSRILQEFQQHRRQLESQKLPSDVLKQALRGLKLQYNSLVESQAIGRRQWLSAEIQVMKIPTASDPTYCLVMKTVKKDQFEAIANDFFKIRIKPIMPAATMQEEAEENTIHNHDQSEAASKLQRSVDSAEAGEPTIDQMCADIHKNYRNRELICTGVMLLVLFVVFVTAAVLRLVVFGGMADRFHSVLSSDPSQIFEVLKLAVSDLALMKYYLQNLLPMQELEPIHKQLTYLMNHAIEIAQAINLNSLSTLGQVSLKSHGPDRIVSGTLFVDSFLSRCKQVNDLIWQNSDLVDEHYPFLPDNVDALVTLSRSSATAVTAEAGLVLKNLNVANLSLMVVVVITALLVIYVMNRYYRAKQNERYALFMNFVRVDMRVSNALEQYYLYCKSNLDRLSQSPPLSYEGYKSQSSEKRRPVKQLRHRSTFWLSCIAFVLMVVCEVVMVSMTNNLKDVCTRMNEVLDQTLQTSNFVSSSGLYFMQLNFVKKASARPAFISATSSSVSPGSQLLHVLNDFYSNEMPSRLSHIRTLLTGDLCTVLQPVLPNSQLKDCLNFQPQALFQVGFVSVNGFYHRTLLNLQLSNELAGRTATMLIKDPTFKSLRATVYLQYEALDLIRQELLYVSRSQTTTLSNLNRTLLSIDLLIKALQLLGAMLWLLHELRHFHSIYQYLMAIPQSEFRQNAYLKAFLFRLSKQNSQSV